MVAEVLALVEGKGYRLPLYACSVQAGFPSPADDYVEGKLDLNAHLIKHPTATFFVRAAGESMIGAGIHPGDILVVDRSLEPGHGKIVIALVEGQLTVKRLFKKGKRVALVPENEKYDPIEIAPESGLVIWGVVTSVVHAL
jgi:DNA polymerase V